MSLKCNVYNINTNYIIICTFANRIKYYVHNQINRITILGTFEKNLPYIHNFDVDGLKHNESSAL